MEMRGHVLAVSYPTQGHITPIRQFCKRLHSKATISDGYDHGGFDSAGSIHDYLKNFKTFGSKTVADIIRKHQTSDNPITCIVYDAFMPWALDVAREFGLAAAPFFRQFCVVNYVYYLSYIKNGSLKFPIEDFPFLEFQDLPSFLSVSGSYPAYFDLVF
ncbi:UDP-glycosyltransferase 74F2 [Cardamine amara subsp. amara]|uniref:UDP-glycosyltransferase 74F2 n=1 Tax=Cardamine amara subsp. amara TaxID=228776 RepID=A0ABD0Z967_CARAN